MDTIYNLFREQVDKHPDDMAVFDENRNLSFRELNRLTDTIADGFPVALPSFVGVIMDHCVEMVASILAILKLGAAYVPVEPTFPIKRIQFIMKECKADFVITAKKYASLLKGLPLHFVEQGIDIDSNIQPLSVHVAPDDIAYVRYITALRWFLPNRKTCS